MSNVISQLLANREENHILPFFWQHGEDEATLRHYVRVIHDANCGAFCVESRPHPDFCGPKWWQDLDAILDEAGKLGMKVWILDDSHFPTGYANGAIASAPAELCRQSICATADGTFPPPFVPNRAEQAMGLANQRKFDDDRVLSTVTLDGTTWTVGLTRNMGYHRNYINMISKKSVRVLIDTVYEPHYAHYGHLFGTVIAGFFSDEPELGDGHLYDKNHALGMGAGADYPFSDEAEAALEKALGADWADKMVYLFHDCGDKAEAARVRETYMDIITGLVRDDFSCQIGDWCRAHGVQYIGHIIEDNGAHTRTGSSLGHYFRGLEGQDMAGIDDIGGQVFPQGENSYKGDLLNPVRNADFYHFMLGRLASSAAAIEKRKQGRAMCEIFGNYGWSEGTALEKYLADHFMVRGVNHFVPHAFSPKAFPDPDCPPHFYAHGHNPQYRHFGDLMKYMNRVCTILSSGERVAPVALVYHAEAEWRGDDFTPNELIARKLEERQIGFDIVPRDYFEKPEHYVDRGYRTVIDCHTKELPEGLAPEVTLAPASRELRVCHIRNDDDIYYLVNEGAEAYVGQVTVPVGKPCYAYDAWENKALRVTARAAEGSRVIDLVLDPRKSLFLVFSDRIPEALAEPVCPEGMAKTELTRWDRTCCAGVDYPNFRGRKPVTLPDRVDEEDKTFSGFVRYETSVELKKPGKAILTVSNAGEAVEVFVNGQSASRQIVPPFVFDLTPLTAAGPNEIAVEVATTMERKAYYLRVDSMSMYEKMRTPEPTAPCGLCGTVTLYTEQ